MYESFEKNTTIMYRPPEMIDKYLKADVDLKVDIWMLGCVLYTLCFGTQPFLNAQNLAILNGSFNIPESKISEHTKKLIKVLL